MVAGTDRDRLAIEERGHVVGVSAAQVEGHDPGAVAEVCGPWMRIVGHRSRQNCQRVVDEFLLVGTDVLHADARQVIEGRAQADRGGHVRRPRLELAGHVVECRVAQLTSRIISPPPMNGGISSRISRRAQRAPSLSGRASCGR